MGIISIICKFGPFKTESCSNILGLDYWYYLIIIPVSLIISFLSYFIYLKTKNIELQIKNFILRTFIISAILFVIILIITFIILYLLSK